MSGSLEEDDPEHRIAFTANVDMIGKYRDGGGGALFMLISSPVAGDQRSQRRLTEKLHNYLAYRQGPKYAKQFGDPAQIVVRIPESSHPAIFRLPDNSVSWAASNKTRLVVERIPTTQ
jgi:hypothetical protein